MPELAIDLTIAWAGIIVLAVVMYVLLDGFDLGVGILFPFAPSDGDRDLMMTSVAPIWDGNETWLVLGGAGLLGAFPLAYAVILSGTYVPLLIMLIALILRGVAFEFRFKAGRSRHLWDKAFHYGSLLATIAQGLVLGTYIQGFEVEGRDYAGGMLDWLTPFTLLTGVALIAGYALLGATWLIWKTEGELQRLAYGWAKPLLFAVLGFVGVVSIWTPVLDPTIAISLWPHAVPPDITIWQAAAAPESQLFLIVGVGALIPVILAYTVFSYYVFRGKVRPGEGYH
ncbi:MAG: cioB [Geminicoccaceae bacterium]|nr:cioB [Geminicoccaceae bacterium]